MKIPFFFLLWLCLQAANANVETTCVSPDGSKSLVLSILPEQHIGSMPGPPDVGLFVEQGETKRAVIDSPLIYSPYRREYGGITWFADEKPQWIGNRYAIFTSEDTIAVVDTSSATMLLDTVFQGITPAKYPNVWAAFSFVATSRQQDKIEEGFTNTLVIINALQLVNDAAKNPDGEPFSHLKKMPLPGKALAKPLWIATDRNEIAVMVAVWDWQQKHAEAMTFRGSDLKLLKKELLKLAVPTEVLYSPWLTPEFESTAVAALNLLITPKPPQLIYGNRAPEAGRAGWLDSIRAMVDNKLLPLKSDSGVIMGAAGVIALLVLSWTFIHRKR